MKKIKILILSIVFILLYTTTLFALTNEEFLDYCSGDAPQDTYVASRYMPIQEILNANPNIDVNFKGLDGGTPLTRLAKNLSRFPENMHGWLTELVAAGAEINHQDASGDSALTIAVATDAWASDVHLLLESGADVTLRNKNGLSALDIAVAANTSPEVLGLLLMRLADTHRQIEASQTENQRLLELAQKNPNPQIPSLMKSWAEISGQEKSWPLIFTAMPHNKELVEIIKNYDLDINKYIKTLSKSRKATASYNYLIWQIHLPNNLDNLILLGNNEWQAWKKAYYLLYKLLYDETGINPVEASPELAKLIVQTDYNITQFASELFYINNDNNVYMPLFILTKNNILVIQHSSNILIGYELSTGRELWSNRFTGTQYTIIDNLILSISAVQDDGLSQIIVIDANNGQMIWQAYNVEYWLTNPEKQYLIISTDSLVAKFDLTKFRQPDWITIDHIIWNINDNDIINLNSDNEAKKILAKQGIDIDYFFTTINKQTNDGYEDKNIILNKGLISFFTEETFLMRDTPKYKFRNDRYLNPQNALSIDNYGFNQYSLWSGDNNRLVIFNRLNSEVYPLAPVQDRAIELKDLKYYQFTDFFENIVRSYYAKFSTSGALLGLCDQNGNIHFFSAKNNGQWLGSLDGQTKVPSLNSPVKDLVFKGVLDDGDPQNPVILLDTTVENKNPILARLDLAKGSLAILPRPSPGETVPITAFALSSANQAATGLENGHLWLLDMVNGKSRMAALKSDSAWAALSYSHDAAFLALADKNGQVVVLDRESNEIWRQSTDLRNITEVAIDNTGRKVWALIQPKDYDSAIKISLITPEKKPLVSELTKNEFSGYIIGLRYNQSEDKAFLVNLLYNLEDLNNELKIIDVPLININAVIKTISGIPTAQDTRFDENYCIFSCSPLLGLSNDKNKLILEGGYEYTQGFNPHYYYDFSLNRVIRLDSGSIQSSRVQAVAFSDDDRLVALAEDGHRIGGSRFLIYNLQNGSVLSAMVDTTRHPLGMRSIAFLHGNPRRLLTVGVEGGLRLWDLSGDAPANLLTWVFFKNDNQAVMSQDSRFDTPDLDRLEGVHWILDKKPGVTVALASLMRSFFQPRLAEYVLNGKPLPPLPSIDQLNLNQHGVRLVEVKPEPDAPGEVAVTVEVYLRGDDSHHPAQELKLFRDGQLVGKFTGENSGLFDLPDGKRQFTFHNIALPKNKNRVMFKSWAFNEDGVRSKYFDRPYEYEKTSNANPNLHLVSIGVNNFDNPAWDLKFSANDAKGYAEILPAKFSGVKSDVQLLTNGEGQIKPSKENFKAALRKLADSGSSPDDIVVLTIASHGLTDDKDNQFYIIPADIPGQDKRVTPELLARSISTDELSEWLADVDAAEIIMILDTCQSGAALGGEAFKPGPMGDKGLGQLAYDKAMLVLTATNENNAAMELDNLGHGLLSYALLEDGLGGGLEGQEITLKDWLAYGKTRTAELYAKISKGESVGGTRGKVKVDQAADNANPPLGQEPYLFDFSGRDKESVRFKIK